MIPCVPVFEREARIKYFRNMRVYTLQTILESNTMIFLVFEEYDLNSRASRSNTTYRERGKRSLSSDELLSFLKPLHDKFL